MLIARTLISPLLLIGAMLAPFPATAQQFQGEPGAPATREFPDLRVLPVPTPPFTGDIQPNLIDSNRAGRRPSRRRRARRTFCWS